MPPDTKRPLNTYYDPDKGRLMSYELEVNARSTPIARSVPLSDSIT